MKCKYEIVLANGSGVQCAIEKGCNCIAVDSELEQKDCDCFEEED